MTAGQPVAAFCRAALRVRQSERSVVGAVKSAFGVASDEASFTLDSPAAVAGLAWDAKDAALRSNRRAPRTTAARETRREERGKVEAENLTFA